MVKIDKIEIESPWKIRWEQQKERGQIGEWIIKIEDKIEEPKPKKQKSDGYWEYITEAQIEKTKKISK